MEEFPFVHRETVRFSDLDGMGHVNNAVYSTYLEQARLARRNPCSSATTTNAHRARRSLNAGEGG